MKHKKLFQTFFALLLLMTLVIPKGAFANQIKDTTRFNEYKSYIEKGYIADDIDYNTWLKLVHESENLGKKLASSKVFIQVYSSKNDRAKSGFSLKSGDVLITNGTTICGITGHAGIAVSPYYILHIGGPGETPQLISLTSWNNEFTSGGNWTAVYRHTSYDVAHAAANWAINTYLNSGAAYLLTSDLYTTAYTYCSKLVWQAYAFGPSPSQATIPYWSLGIIYPYDLPNLINDISLVYGY